MKKVLLALTLLILTSMTTVYAQSSTSAPAAAANPFGIIIKGGVNFANISTQNNGSYSSSNNLTTFNVGVLADIPLMDVLSLQPGVVLTGNGSKASGSISGITSTTKFNPLYLQVPVNFVAKIPMGNTARFFVGAGPYGAAGIGGKWKNTTTVGGINTTVDRNIKFGTGNDDDLKRFDFGLNGLAGVEISRFLVGVNYGLGFSKIFPNSSANASSDKNKYRVFSVNVGVKI